LFLANGDIAYFVTCVCGEREATPVAHNGISYKRCVRCHLKRRAAPAIESMFLQDLMKYEDTYSHSLEEDTETAKKRLGQWHIPRNSRLFDIGSGLGCFVKECRNAGIKAEGNDARKPLVCEEHIYHDTVERLHHPPGDFDIVTSFHAIEHVGDPTLLFKQAYRLLKFGGRFLIEWPDFEDEKHHKAEHSWMFYPQHVIALARNLGFEYVENSLRAPIPGNFAVEFKKPAGRRRRILVPPGIGDIYWVTTKLPALMQEWEDETEPIIDVLFMEKDQRKRGLEWLKLVPHVVAGEYVSIGDYNDPVWREGYYANARTVFNDYLDRDHFVLYNGVLRHGCSLEESHPAGLVDWFHPLFRSREQRIAEEEYRGLGKYVIALLLDQSVHKSKWNKEFPLKNFKPVFDSVVKEYGYSVVSIGHKADPTGRVNNAGFGSNSKLIDMHGQTTVEQLMALINLSCGSIGHPSGPTIMSTRYKKPTVMVWNRHFNEKFWWNACSPATWRTIYHAEDTKDTSPEAIFSKYQSAHAAWKRATPRHRYHTAIREAREATQQRRAGLAKVTDFHGIVSTRPD